MDHLTSVELARRCNIESDIAEVLRQRRLRWLGHIARMDDSRLPKQVLFGELPSKRPRHGPKKPFWDVVAADLVDRGIAQQWYELAQDLIGWWDNCQPPEPSQLHYDSASYGTDEVFVLWGKSFSFIC